MTFSRTSDMAIMGRRVVIAFFLFSSAALSQSAAFAGEALYERHLANGVAALEMDDFKKAAAELRAADAEKPGDPQAALYLGIALVRSGDPEADAVLAGARKADPSNPRVALESGILRMTQGRYKEAESFFHDVERLAPDSEFSRSATLYADDARGLGATGGKAKRWALDLAAGGQYDTNVVQSATDFPLPQGLARKSDYRVVLQGQGAFKIISGADRELAASYELYRNYHRNLPEFDMEQHGLCLNGGGAITPYLSAKASYGLELVRLGGDRYGYAHIVNPRLVVKDADGASTVLEYRWKRSFFSNGDLFTGNDGRSGDDHMVGLSQEVRIGLADVKVGLRHDRDYTRLDYWDSRGTSGFVAGTIRLPARLLLRLYGEYGKREYQGEYPDTGLLRRDISRVYSATLSLPVTGLFSVSVGHTLAVTSSNIESFAFDRNVTSLLVNARLSP